MLENTKTTHWHCKTLLQLSPIILSVLFECPIFWSDFFLFAFCSNFFVQSIWMPIFFSDIFVWSIYPIFLSFFFLFAFSSDFLSLECTIFCPIYLSDFLSDLCECPIFSPNFLSNFLSKQFECSLFSSDFFCPRFVRFNGANYSASMSSFSLSKIDGQTRLIKSKLFISCLACANFVIVILLLATFWCSVTMFTKLQFLISNFGTAGVLSLSITVASYQRRILSIKQDIMVFHCMKTKIL